MNSQPEKVSSDELTRILSNFTSEGATGSSQTIQAVRKALASSQGAENKTWLEFILACELKVAGQPGAAIPILTQALGRDEPNLQSYLATELMACCTLRANEMLKSLFTVLKESNDIDVGVSTAYTISTEALRLLDTAGQYYGSVDNRAILSMFHRVRADALWRIDDYQPGRDNRDWKTRKAAWVSELSKYVEFSDDKVEARALQLKLLKEVGGHSEEALDVARQLLELDPGNVEAIRFVSEAQTQAPASSPAVSPAMKNRNAWPWILGVGAVVAFLGIGLVVVIFALASVATNSNKDNNSNVSSSKIVSSNTNRTSSSPSTAARNPNRSETTSTNNNSDRRLSLDDYCRSKHGDSAVAVNTVREAFAWRCMVEDVGGNKRYFEMNMDEACQMQYGGNFKGAVDNPNDFESWHCIPNNVTNPSTNLPAPFTDDFSAQRWGIGTSQYGRMWYQNGEYHMSATKSAYIVMYGPNRPEYNTENATVRVGLRSVDGSSPNAGYGLVVHGEKKEGKLEDYAFLIYSGPGAKYKIVEHKAGIESNLVGWTPSSAIRTGTSPNQIEVRIHDLKLDFYVNGQFVTSVTDTEGYRRGQVGFYTSDTGEVAFDDLELLKQ